MRTLSLSCNDLVTLPATIAELVALESLNVAGNRLVELPSGIGQMVPRVRVILGLGLGVAVGNR